MPFPQNEANAMDVVIQFAIHKLGFQLSDIVVYAWSIGGFTGTQRQEQYNPVTKTKVVILFKIEIQTMQSFAFKLCLPTTVK